MSGCLALSVPKNHSLCQHALDLLRTTLHIMAIFGGLIPQGLLRVAHPSTARRPQAGTEGCAKQFWTPVLERWFILVLQEAIAIWVEAMAIRVEAIAIGVEAIASRVEAIAIWVEAMAIRVEAIAIGVEAIVSASSWYCRREAHEKESSVPYPRTGDHALATLVFGFTPVFNCLPEHQASRAHQASFVFGHSPCWFERTKRRRRKGEKAKPVAGVRNEHRTVVQKLLTCYTVHEREGSVQGFCRSSL